MRLNLLYVIFSCEDVDENKASRTAAAEPRIVKAEKKEENTSMEHGKLIKSEIIEGESPDKQNMLQKDMDIKPLMVPRLDAIQPMQQQQHMHNPNIAIQGQQMRFTQSFRPNINQQHIQTQGQQVQQQQLMLKIGNRPTGQIISMAAQNQFKQQVVNQPNVNVVQNQSQQHLIPAMVRQADQNQGVEQTGQHPQGQVQFQQNPQIRGKFVSQNQQLAQV